MNYPSPIAGVQEAFKAKTQGRTTLALQPTYRCLATRRPVKSYFCNASCNPVMST
jgi:hypothetical protein